jgi:hypothetical protein
MMPNCAGRLIKCVNIVNAASRFVAAFRITCYCAMKWDSGVFGAFADPFGQSAYNEAGFLRRRKCHVRHHPAGTPRHRG